MHSMHSLKNTHIWLCSFIFIVPLVKNDLKLFVCFGLLLHRSIFLIFNWQLPLASLSGNVRSVHESSWHWQRNKYTKWKQINTNKITSHMKKKSSIYKIITVNWMKRSDRISTYGSRKQSVPSGNSSYEKRILVRVNDRWATPELEWVLCTSSGQVGTVHLSRMSLFKDESDICILPGRGYSFVIKWLLEERGEDRGQLGCRLLLRSLLAFLKEREQEFDQAQKLCQVYNQIT